jgi:hypothetical protein
MADVDATGQTEQGGGGVEYPAAKLVVDGNGQVCLAARRTSVAESRQCFTLAPVLADQVGTLLSHHPSHARRCTLYLYQ